MEVAGLVVRRCAAGLALATPGVIPHEDVALTLRRFYHRLIAQAGAAASRKDPVAACDSLIRQTSFMLKAWQAIAAERGGPSTVVGATAKGPHASVVGRTMDHAHGGLSGGLSA